MAPGSQHVFLIEIFFVDYFTIWCKSFQRILGNHENTQLPLSYPTEPLFPIDDINIKEYEEATRIVSEQASVCRQKKKYNQVQEFEFNLNMLVGIRLRPILRE